MPEEQPGRTLGFVLAASVVGALTGGVAGAFKRLLELAVHARAGLLSWAHPHGVLGLLVVVAATSALAAGAAALVRRLEPHADGSGIPRVEAVVDGRTGFGRRRILPVKFVGSLMAIGSGLALGREGPMVQMGGSAGITVGRALRQGPADLRLLVGAGAAAGLATAFNAPIAGAVFVLEELLKRFSARATVATLCASSAGFAAARLLVGDAPEFPMPPVAAPGAGAMAVALVVGLVCGVLGALYNRLVLGCLDLADAVPLPVEARAGLVGVAVGLLAWCWPGFVGGGDNLTLQALQGSGTLVLVAVLLFGRAVLGAVSYAAGTPGGLFAPMLVLGTHVGLLVALCALALHPGEWVDPAAMALVGMACFFAATVRAPVTGIVLATEMTQTTALLPAMLGACAVAMVLAQVAGSEPIYEALARRNQGPHAAT